MLLLISKMGTPKDWPTRLEKQLAELPWQEVRPQAGEPSTLRVVGPEGFEPPTKRL
jgi:hypothetical protein